MDNYFVGKFNDIVEFLSDLFPGGKHTKPSPRVHRFECNGEYVEWDEKSKKYEIAATEGGRFEWYSETAIGRHNPRFYVTTRLKSSKNKGTTIHCRIERDGGQAKKRRIKSLSSDRYRLELETLIDAVHNLPAGTLSIDTYNQELCEVYRNIERNGTIANADGSPGKYRELWQDFKQAVAMRLLPVTMTCQDEVLDIGGKKVRLQHIRFTWPPAGWE